MGIDPYCVGICYGVCLGVTEGAGLLICYAGCEAACAAAEPDLFMNRFQLSVGHNKEESDDIAQGLVP
jgi:hypothetical protein